MDKVSVVLPVYNAEKYVKRILDELCGQTYKDLEVIVIDDGSSDGTGKLVEECAVHDDRIRYCYQENAGVGAARNKGIDISSTEYITFIDVDDEIEADYIENLIKPLLETGGDLSVCDIDNINTETGEHKLSVIRLPYGLTRTAEDSNVISKVRTFSWGKIYKKSLWTNNNVRYPEGELYRTLPGFEDVCCLPLVAAYSEKIVHVAGSPYHYYRGHRDSLMDQSKFSYFRNSQIEIMKRLRLTGIDERVHPAVRKFLMGQLHSANRWELTEAEYEELWKLVSEFLPEIKALKDYQILVKDKRAKDVLGIALFDQRSFTQEDSGKVLVIPIPDIDQASGDNYESYCYDAADQVLDQLPEILKKR